MSPFIQTLQVVLDLRRLVSPEVQNRGYWFRLSLRHIDVRMLQYIQRKFLRDHWKSRIEDVGSGLSFRHFVVSMLQYISKKS